MVSHHLCALEYEGIEKLIADPQPVLRLRRQAGSQVAVSGWWKVTTAAPRLIACQEGWEAGQA